MILDTALMVGAAARRVLVLASSQGLGGLPDRVVAGFGVAADCGLILLHAIATDGPDG